MPKRFLVYQTVWPTEPDSSPPAPAEMKHPGAKVKQSGKRKNFFLWLLGVPNGVDLLVQNVFDLGTLAEHLRL